MSLAFNVTIKPDPKALAYAFMNQNIPSFLRGEINRLAASVERYSKQLTPVRTGMLRKSINFAPATMMLKTVVSTHSDYAIYVHEGTKYMRSRPFMKYGAMFAQTNLEYGVATRLDQKFVQGFRYGGFR